MSLYTTEDAPAEPTQAELAATLGAATRLIDERLRGLYAEAWRLSRDPSVRVRCRNVGRLWVRVMTTVLEAAFPLPPEAAGERMAE